MSAVIIIGIIVLIIVLMVREGGKRVSKKINTAVYDLLSRLSSGEREPAITLDTDFNSASNILKVMPNYKEFPTTYYNTAVFTSDGFTFVLLESGSNSILSVSDSTVE